MATASIVLLAWFSTTCGPTKPTGSDYLGKWKGTVESIIGDEGECYLDISAVGESYVIKSECQRIGNCSAYEGIWTLTPEGNLKGGLNGNMLIAYDKAKREAVVSGLGKVRYLRRITTSAKALIGRWEAVKAISRFKDGTEKTVDNLPYRAVRSFAEDGTVEAFSEREGRQISHFKGTFAVVDESHFTQTIRESMRPEDIGRTVRFEYRINCDELVTIMVPYFDKPVPNQPISLEAHYKPLK